MTSVSVVLHAPQVASRPSTPCEADPDLFFPVSEAGRSLVQIAEAKQLCRRCPRVADCLRDALDEGHDYGIWGATTGAERRRIRRRKPAEVSR